MLTITGNSEGARLFCSAYPSQVLESLPRVLVFPVPNSRRSRVCCSTGRGSTELQELLLGGDELLVKLSALRLVAALAVRLHVDGHLHLGLQLQAVLEVHRRLAHLRGLVRFRLYVGEVATTSGPITLVVDGRVGLDEIGGLSSSVIPTTRRAFEDLLTTEESSAWTASVVYQGLLRVSTM